MCVCVCVGAHPTKSHTICCRTQFTVCEQAKHAYNSSAAAAAIAFLFLIHSLSHLLHYDFILTVKIRIRINQIKLNGQLTFYCFNWRRFFCFSSFHWMHLLYSALKCKNMIFMTSYSSWATRFSHARYMPQAHFRRK